MVCWCWTCRTFWSANASLQKLISLSSSRSEAVALISLFVCSVAGMRWTRLRKSWSSSGNRAICILCCSLAVVQSDQVSGGTSHALSIFRYFNFKICSVWFGVWSYNSSIYYVLLKLLCLRYELECSLNSPSEMSKNNKVKEFKMYLEKKYVMCF